MTVLARSTTSSGVRLARRLSLLLLSVGGLSFGVLASAAAAQTGQPPTSVGGGQTTDGGEVHLGQDGGSGTSNQPVPGGGGSTVICVLRSIPEGGDPSQLGLGPEVTAVELGSSYWRICTDRATGAEVSVELVTAEQVDPRAAAEAAAKFARSQLQIPQPSIGMNPPGGRAVVNIATWLWVTGPSILLSPPAALGGVTATVTAASTRVEWETGPHEVLRCGLGTPYDPSRPARSQHTDCSSNFSGASGARRILARQIWHLTYTASNGISGDLGDETFTTSVPVEVTPLTTVIREATD